MSVFCDVCWKYVDLSPSIFGDPSDEARRIDGRLVCAECEEKGELEGCMIMAKRKTILGIPKCGYATPCAPSAPAGCSALKLTGYEANLLLFAFDDYFGTDNEGTVRDTRSLDTLDNLQRLRDALFAAHDHEPNPSRLGTTASNQPQKEEKRHAEE